MNTGLIIFSRFDSTRLPGKALRKVGPNSLLGHVIARSRRVKGNFPIVLATTDRLIDDPLAEFAISEGIEVFRGALDDVAGRAVSCARYFGFDRFVRICGDRPFLDPELIDVLLLKQLKDNLDLATNAAKKTYSAGVATEVVSTSALESALTKTNEVADREHVTRYFYQHPNDFSIFNIEATDERYADVNLAIDTELDLHRAEWIMERLNDPVLASLDEVVSLALACPIYESSKASPDQKSKLRTI
jgi:spore coat polysaccharide biosynthesis protein SpsF